LASITTTTTTSKVLLLQLLPQTAVYHIRACHLGPVVCQKSADVGSQLFASSPQASP